METKVLKTDLDDISVRGMECAGEILKKGGLVAFPTETVYGLGGDGLNPESSKKIYAAKGRPSDNPLIIHICKMEDLPRIARNIPETAYQLAEAFWPGPLTMILQKTDAVPRETTGGLDTVAVRMPSHPVAKAMIEAGGGFIAAPSANTSGRPSPTRAEHCIEDLDGKIEMIIDGGDVGIGLESTIVDLTEEDPVILRPGYVTEEMLEEVLRREVSVDRAILDASSGMAPKAPGMKYRHYAPKAPLLIVSGEQEAVTRKIRELTNKKHAAGERVGIICTTETLSYYEADTVACAGSRENEEEIARHLFGILRDFDGADVSAIYSEAFPDKGIGQAVMNRLLKAAGHQVLHV